MALIISSAENDNIAFEIALTYNMNKYFAVSFNTSAYCKKVKAFYLFKWEFNISDIIVYAT